MVQPHGRASHNGCLLQRDSWAAGNASRPARVATGGLCPAAWADRARSCIRALSAPARISVRGRRPCGSARGGVDARPAGGIAPGGGGCAREAAGPGGAIASMVGLALRLDRRTISSCGAGGVEGNAVDWMTAAGIILPCATGFRLRRRTAGGCSAWRCCATPTSTAGTCGGRWCGIPGRWRRA